MNKLKNLLFSFLNILVIAAILVFIMWGLWKIGLIELPFLDKLSGNQSTEAPEKKHNSTEFLESTENLPKYDFESTELNGDTVKKMLSELKPSFSFAQDLQYTLISESSVLNKRVFVIKHDSVYCAFFLSGDGNVEKQIIRNDYHTTVNTLTGSELQGISYNNGDIDFGSQAGIILTHKDFLPAADDPAYTFEIGSDDNGTVMKISFTSAMGEYTQVQEYTLSLDYGVVTEASCYENGKLIYSLSTNSLSDELKANFNIPEEYLMYLPASFEYEGQTSPEELSEE